MKKKMFSFIASAIILFVLSVSIGCPNNPTTTTTAGGSDTTTTTSTTTTTLADLPTTIPANNLRIHYKRTNGDYAGYGLWLWGTGVANPSAGWPTGSTPFAYKDTFGVAVDIPLSSTPTNVGFVVLKIADGDSGKDGGDKSFGFLTSYKEIWVFEGDNNVYISAEKGIPQGILTGFILSETQIELTLTANTDLSFDGIVIKDKDGVVITKTGTSYTKVGDKITVGITSTDFTTKKPYSVTYGGKTISITTGYATTDNKYSYDGNDLGANFNSTDNSATFKLWAPDATKVQVVIYDAADQTKTVGTKDLVLGSSGIWSLKVSPADLTGVSTLKNYFYQYKVTNAGVEKTCLDPYAKSMAEFYIGTDGNAVSGATDTDKVGKGAIIDLTADTGSVSGYAPLNPNFKREDAVIYEVHIRDFTSFWGVNTSGTTATEVAKPTEPLGTYKAFIQNLDYLKNMGYTHIQLLPVMNFYYGDESNKTIESDYKGADCNYNWGFDPHHYFAPEGMYATDSKNPITRIKELKELIQAIHDKGMGVVLDVVYTHMAKADFLNDIVPNYYFFMQNGAFVGGFGNNLATTHKMAKKLMIDSVKYWTKEYKVDGFRFDMMGDADQKSIMEAYDEAAKINSKILFVGEGWRTFAGEGDGAYGATQDAMNEMNTGAERVGVFSDEFRNLMKSGFGAEGTPKFITGGKEDITKIFKNIKGQPTNFNTNAISTGTKDTADDPGQCVQYIAAHDNMTLFDIISRHIQAKPDDANGIAEIHKRTRLGNLIVATTQGIAFFHAGQELGVTKQYKGTDANQGTKITEVTYKDNSTVKFVHDSYDSSDAVNQINWSFIETGKPGRLTMTYTKGLLALRRSTNAFRLGTKSLVDTNITKIDFDNETATSDLVIGYKVVGSDASYYVFINADSVSRSATTPTDLSTGATVLVDNDEAGITAVTTISGVEITSTKVTLEPLTAVIIKK
ncbi:MAG: hypothetical protein A2086_08020 [Spirochaetes bacterium GWD1_27_9]|nr:MAG: hypothetical protein A2Z98_07150 [Spirochaetes bacterium GWB1_27_13]OHD25154.1 MAG: hypothetical protein A2Y34_16840 [Spirochaetes bacterium GWC1_27_15]OHD34468.1 MAG: hypothetical protein A2086_08020 [Spirochaetes bacterium GWD1_27_9]